MSKQTIVIAEDDEVLGKVINEELSEAGFTVHHAHNGAEAVKLVNDKKPDLLLLDVLMPEKDGFQVLEEVKKSLMTKEVPVIMLTMLGADDDIKKGLKLGAVDYIVKSQHAVGEIVDKVKEFFGQESHPDRGEVADSTATAGELGQSSEVRLPKAPEGSKPEVEQKVEKPTSEGTLKVEETSDESVVDLRKVKKPKEKSNKKK